MQSLPKLENRCDSTDVQEARDQNINIPVNSTTDSKQEGASLNEMTQYTIAEKGSKDTKSDAATMPPLKKAKVDILLDNRDKLTYQKPKPPGGTNLALEFRKRAIHKM